MDTKFCKLNLEYDNEVPYNLKLHYEVDLLEYKEKYINQAYFSKITNSIIKIKTRITNLY